MILEIPEKFLRSNELFDLFEVDGVPVQARLLSANVAEKWASGARKVDGLDMSLEYLAGRLEAVIKARAEASDDERATAESNVGKMMDAIRDTQGERYNRILGSLREYGAPFDDGIFGTATSAQLVGAFHLLKQYNDPFVVMGSLQLEALKQMRTLLSSGTKP
jgi:hypothetical protein